MTRLRTESPALPPARAVCLRCRRPESVCYCEHLTSIPTATRVVLLQHPRERDRAIGTAHMASLCLPNSELHVGFDWGESPALARALSDPARPAALLYPSEGAADVSTHPPPGPITLVVVDGTWPQTRKLLKHNPILAALPRLAFTPSVPSQYRIRSEPNPSCVSTIEALLHVLGALEGDPARFEALRAPFRAMVETQLACEERFRAEPPRHAQRTGPRRSPIPDGLRQRPDDVVCVLGEANSWSYRSPERTRVPDEIVHWVAQRLTTGEAFDCIVAARGPLAPGTATHVKLDVAELCAGVGFPELLARWSGFARPTDVVCSWGWYASRVFAANGGRLPETRVDVRQVTREVTCGKVGTIEECAARLGVTPDPNALRGRAGSRLGHLTAIVRHLRDQ